MKRILILLSILGVVILTGCSSAKKKKNIKIYNKNIVFSMEDQVGDDNGPGSYVYPTDKIYMQGAFDIINFEVDNIASDSPYYEFKISINNYFKDDVGYFGNWDIQMFDIYLNTGEGKYTQAISGRNLKIKDGWDKAILVAPEREVRIKDKIYDENKEVSDDISDYENLTTGIILPKMIEIQNNKIVIRVLKDQIGDWKNVKGIQVFSMGFDPNSDKDQTYNMKVDEFTGQDNFGGGTNYDGNPNVMDILGDNSKMKRFKSEEGIQEFAEVDLIKVNH